MSAPERAPVPGSVCAVAVTFHPDDAVIGNLAAIAAQSGRLLIVDNGSPPAAVERLRSWASGRGDAELLALPSNEGLAAALNRGLERAQDLGFEYAVTFDQDSEPAPGMVGHLCDALAEHPRSDAVALVGPAIVDRNVPAEEYRWLAANPRLPLLFERVAAGAGRRDDVTCVITSGSLVNLAVFRELGPFCEGLFIDYVDHEFCLRARTAGYLISVTGRARLLHSLGAKRRIRVGRYSIEPTFHSAQRLYYVYRNRIPLLLRYGLRQPHWLAFDTLATARNLLRMALFEDDRRAKLLAVLEGTWDGLMGRRGPRPRRGAS